MELPKINLEQGSNYLSEILGLVVKKEFLLDAIKVIWLKRERASSSSLKGSLLCFLGEETELSFSSFLLKEIEERVLSIRSDFLSLSHSHPHFTYSISDYIYFVLSTFKFVPDSYLSFLKEESAKGKGWASFYLSISSNKKIDNFKYANLAITQNVLDGYESLSLLYLNIKDQANMLKILKEGADLGVESCAYYYASSLIKKNGDPKEISHYLGLGKYCGIGEALYEYALTFFNDKYQSVNKNEGEKWLIKASQSGSLKAPLYLGKAYLKGALFSKSDFEQAEKYLLIAFSRGQVEAGRLLAKIYRGEFLDTPPSLFHPRRAFTLLKNLAKSHEPNALYEIGEMHLYGIGMKCDPLKAAKYYARATMLGSIESEKRLKEMLLGGYYTGFMVKDIRLIFLANALLTSSKNTLLDLAEIYEEGILTEKPDFLEGKKMRQIALKEDEYERFLSLTRLIYGEERLDTTESC